MTISSIDELLLSGGEAPNEPEQVEDIEEDEPEHADETESEESEDNDSEPDDSGEDEDTEENEKPVPKAKNEVDEYGNEKEPENEAIRERLARQARKHEAEITALRSQLSQQNAPPAVQQAARDFEYDPNSNGDWQQQLKDFVKQTVNSMSHEQEATQRQRQEQAAQAEFETKFRQGMGNFDDFVEVIQGLPCDISDAMTIATRAMDNPAAFLYAAAKRNPQELERISKIRDPYVQVAEMGKLEERMRKNKPTTKAPRPLGRVSEDSTIKTKPKQKEMSGDDLLASADSARIGQVKARLKSNR